MCGIFFAQSSDKKKQQIFEQLSAGALETIRSRGPDRQEVYCDGGFVMGHTHLRITGNKNQPIQNSQYVISFNGEIYNNLEIENADIDSQFLEGKILDDGFNAFGEFDGEFAIIAASKKNNKVWLSTDCFGTKPLYMSLGPDYFVCGTYESTVLAFGVVGAVQLPANTAIEVDLREYKISAVKELFKFDFSGSNVDSYEPWIESFRESIRKRTHNKDQKYFVSFSAGHDSGLIAAEMMQQKVPYKVYSCPYMEDMETLIKRLVLLEENGVFAEKIIIDEETVNRHKDLLSSISYQVYSSDFSLSMFPRYEISQINGYIASSVICQKARLEGRLISLNGQGADEIVSDYFNEFGNSRKSELMGKWSHVNRPWRNFFGGWNRIFLGATERVSGLHGIESRYPFLDRKLVQNYIHISPKLKEKEYKAPIAERLRQLGFPFHRRKQGFAGYE